MNTDQIEKPVSPASPVSPLSVVKRRPASWAKAEAQGSDWDGNVISILARPMETPSLAIGLEAEEGISWKADATRVASMFLTVAVGFFSWVLSVVSSTPAPTYAGMGLVSVLMR
jgi:hypothetical protein